MNLNDFDSNVIKNTNNNQNLGQSQIPSTIPVSQEEKKEVVHEALEKVDSVVMPYNNKENNMAEVDTMMLAEQHSDIRKEAVDHTNEIVREGLKEAFHIRGDIKDSRYDVSSRVVDQGNRVSDRLAEHDAKVADRFFAIGRDTEDIRAQIIAQQQQMVAGFLGVSKDVELNSLKAQLENQKNTQFLSDKISMENDRTRALINDLKYHDLNRGLIERNTALVESESLRDHWKRCYDDCRFDGFQKQYSAQWAQLQNQVQAFQSQLQETRQGMVNFGTMAGVGQSSTSNNVR